MCNDIEDPPKRWVARVMPQSLRQLLDTVEQLVHGYGQHQHLLDTNVSEETASRLASLPGYTTLRAELIDLENAALTACRIEVELAESDEGTRIELEPRP